MAPRKFSEEFKTEAVRAVVESSRTIADVARENGIGAETLRKWVNKYRREHAGDEPALSEHERTELARLRKENRELKMEQEFPKKSGGLLRQGVPVSAKYAFINGEEGNYPLRSMCTWANVSRSGYCAWRKRKPSATARWRAELGEIIEHIFVESDRTYGHRRVHAALARMGRACDPQTVRSVMAERGLVACQPRRRRPVTTVASDAGSTPDLVQRDFTATEPGVKLVGDITYIDTWQGWVYLATVLDCFSKKVVGYAMAAHMRTELVTAALDMAARNGRVRKGVTIFHSDRGTQYTSQEFADHTQRLGITRSVGRTGICYDNAWAESFNATLKVERVHRTAYPTREHAVRDVTRYIELRYNQNRLHSALDYRTPNEVEHAWYESNETA
ncbi:IS3 family transposase [Georgenia sp. TF02-10]|uniref:IS3 family transposase n=1 Tax=Georgenia sp. TF02-10 TaxID=2917725 RepID=UPI001FA815E1|nr:IS3 family transposase [Georgenia sp. TF02-10]UNX53349.1 IS3 family transposase [Georgenia sp. TF02-10]